MQIPFFFSWPIIIIFIVIILLAACIICVALQDSGRSRPRSYVRTSPQDPWQPVEESDDQTRQWEPSEHQVDVLVCSCGKWNGPRETTCWNCHTSLSSIKPQTFTFETAERCAICGFWVYPGEIIVLCPSCQAQAHRTHFLEYIKAKGSCPVCKIRLSARQLLNTIPKITSKDANSLTEVDTTG
ncbi:MAG: hypothetical protein ACFFBR_04200 [Promethearchaeota archaeon]